MRSILSIGLLAFLIASCASQVMEKYIGKDICEVYLEHGKPANEFMLGDGRRVFQFYWGESSAGSPYGHKGGCLLSYITKRDNAAGTWTVVETKYPDRIVC